jgi:hypothetical protein
VNTLTGAGESHIPTYQAQSFGRSNRFKVSILGSDDATFVSFGGAVRTAAVERDESSSARSHGADPQDHGGSAGGRIQAAHQEGFGIQTLGQKERKTETVILQAA